MSQIWRKSKTKNFGNKQLNRELDVFSDRLTNPEKSSRKTSVNNYFSSFFDTTRRGNRTLSRPRGTTPSR